MKFVHNFKIIKNEIQTHLNKVSLIVVSKNQTVEKINYLITEGHKDFGENRVQEAKSKWSDILKKNTNLKLHFIGKLQSNKIKGIGELFEFIHFNFILVLSDNSATTSPFSFEKNGTITSGTNDTFL